MLTYFACVLLGIWIKWRFPNCEVYVYIAYCTLIVCMITLGINNAGTNLKGWFELFKGL